MKLPTSAVRVWMASAKRPAGFYVSAILGPRRSLVAGPFRTHRAALAAVEVERSKWVGLDPRATFAAWGTCWVGTRRRKACGCKPACERFEYH